MVPTGEHDVWLFDLDGVITGTASVHAAWKRTFDRYLREVAEREGRSFEPFEIDSDYYRYVDAKPRYNGLDSFLPSRGMVQRCGDPGDPPESEADLAQLGLV